MEEWDAPLDDTTAPSSLPPFPTIQHLLESLTNASLCAAAAARFEMAMTQYTLNVNTRVNRTRVSLEF